MSNQAGGNVIPFPAAAHSRSAVAPEELRWHNSRLADRQRRRRLSVASLSSAFFIALLVGFVSGSTAMWVLAGFVAALMVAYLLLLARCVASEAEPRSGRSAARRNGFGEDGSEAHVPQDHVGLRVRLLAQERTA